MKVLIIGSGGREYSIGIKIKNQNPKAQLYFSPGNGGTSELGKNISLANNSEILTFAIQQKINLTIVGPEIPLMEGLVDDFKTHNLTIFGPHKKAAILEGSKTFAKDFMQKHGVKTAQYKNFKHYIDAKEHLKTANFPLVIKASGLAAGKGVFICKDEFEAQQNLKEIMNDKVFGDAGNEIVIEEFLQGFECSILSIFNGKEIYPMLTAKDHKKIGENETGLNTGGMGVVVPNPLFTEAHFTAFKKDILAPTLKGLLKENLNFSGVIFFGLMINENGVYLLEYNLRFGDPETQTILPLLENNLLEVLQDSISQKPLHLKWKKAHSCCIVIASGGYPLNYEKGFEISGLNQLSEQDFAIAGAQKIDHSYYTSGGRVLNILAQDNTLQAAITAAYKKTEKIHFDYQYYRKDIGNINKINTQIS